MRKLFLCLFILFIVSLLKAQVSEDPLFNEVEALLDNAKKQSADVLCPEYFTEALKYYMNAKELQETGGAYNDRRGELERSVMYVTRMNEGLERKIDFFNSQIAARKSALELNADKYAVYSWSLGEKYFYQAVDVVEAGDYQTASERLPDIEKYYNEAKSSAEKANLYLYEWEPLNNSNSVLANLLSPQYYSEGISKFNEALDAISNASGKEKVDALIAEAGTDFNSAETVAKEFARNYPTVLNERSAAKNAGAENYAADIWIQAEKYLADAGELYEEEGVANAGSANEIARYQYILARQEAVKIRFLDLAEKQIALAEDVNADELAPKTYDKSVYLFNDAVRRVDSDKYTEEEIQKLGNAAFSEASKAIRIVQIIRDTEAGNNTWEDVILSGNILPENFYSSVVLSDLNKPSVVQSETENVDVAIPTVKYYDDLYKIFSPDEAEVVETANQVIIRLTGMEFAPLLSALNDKDKIILRKAIEALRLFPDENITIEGHTDNVCTRAMNDRISQERAETVRIYLIQNSNIRSSRLKAIGYGESQPITDNKTDEGRRKNRRIDLVINL